MNQSFRRKSSGNISTFLFLFLGITVSFLNLSCNKAGQQNHYVLQVDMSKEHDAGRFKPEQGDKLFVAGNFNGWKKYEVMLSDLKGNWIYSANIDDYLERKGAPSDTLGFNFLIQSGPGREVLNQGWETIPMRKIAISRLTTQSPVFVYNEVFDEKESFDVTFTVGMNNEETLGFFQPDKGDEIVVSGSFCNWSSQGVALDDQSSGIYSKKITLRQNPNDPLEYRFRIIPKRKAVIPDQGWETRPVRQAVLSKSSVELPYAEFNDIRRVARFVINSGEWEQEGKFRPLKGDILQIKLLLDGKQTLSDALFQVGEKKFETAIMIPLTVRDVQWQVMEDMKNELTPIQDVQVGLNGAVIKN
jgi:hypothetical protein